MTFWASPSYSTGYGIFAFIWNYVVPLVVFIFCYTKIIWIVRESSMTIRTVTVNRTTVDNKGRAKPPTTVDAKQVIF